MLVGSSLYALGLPKAFVHGYLNGMVGGSKKAALPREDRRR